MFMGRLPTSIVALPMIAVYSWMIGVLWCLSCVSFCLSVFEFEGMSRCSL